MVGELNRPPYEKGNAGAALYEHARTLAAEIGFDRLRSGSAPVERCRVDGSDGPRARAAAGRFAGARIGLYPGSIDKLW